MPGRDRSQQFDYFCKSARARNPELAARSITDMDPIRKITIKIPGELLERAQAASPEA
jgi:hypothetical protein